jgi:hypothetical protein
MSVSALLGVTGDRHRVARKSLYPGNIALLFQADYKVSRFPKALENRRKSCLTGIQHNQNHHDYRHQRGQLD